VIYAFIPPCGIECLAIIFNTAMIMKLSIEQHVLCTVFILLTGKYADYDNMRFYERYRDISISTLQNLNY